MLPTCPFEPPPLEGMYLSVSEAVRGLWRFEQLVRSLPPRLERAIDERLFQGVVGFVPEIRYVRPGPEQRGLLRSLEPYVNNVGLVLLPARWGVSLVNVLQARRTAPDLFRGAREEAPLELLARFLLEPRTAEWDVRYGRFIGLPPGASARFFPAEEAFERALEARTLTRSERATVEEVFASTSTAPLEVRARHRRLLIKASLGRDQVALLMKWRPFRNSVLSFISFDEEDRRWARHLGEVRDSAMDFAHHMKLLSPRTERLLAQEPLREPSPFDVYEQLASWSRGLRDRLLELRER